jgi:hypothetical protein
MDAPCIPEMLPVIVRSKRSNLRGKGSLINHHAMERSLDGVDASTPIQALDDAMIHKTLLGFQDLALEPEIRPVMKVVSRRLLQRPHWD